MNRPERLSAAFVDKVDRVGRYTDGPGGHGLSLLVRPRKDGLAKNWQQQLKVNGKLRSLGLGSYPEVKLVEARKVATEQAAKLKEAYPARPRKSSFERLLAEAEGRNLSVYPTFAQVAEEALEHDRRKWKGTTTETQRRGLIKTYLNPVLGDLEIDRISSDDIMEALRSIWHDKAPTARKAWLALVATINYSIGKNYVAIDPLPKAKIGLGRQKATVEHREAIPYEQIPEVWRVLQAAKPSSVTRVIEFLILTAARSGEARGARWGEFDMADAIWTLPPERMKGARQHRVPLSAPSIDVIRQAREAAPSPIHGHELIFPNGGGREVTRMMPLRFFQRRYEGYTLHGFRSTFQDWAAEQTDTPAEIVEHALAHLEGSATIRAYRRTDYFEKRRELMGAWANYVTAR